MGRLYAHRNVNVTAVLLAFRTAYDDAHQMTPQLTDMKTKITGQPTTVISTARHMPGSPITRRALDL